jgi:hypothetical protein
MGRGDDTFKLGPIFSRDNPAIQKLPHGHADPPVNDDFRSDHQRHA